MPPDLTGRWEQEHGEGATYYQIAVISEDAIRVYWHLTEDDSEYLYWSGSFTDPEASGKAFKWVSENNHAEQRKSAWARREETMNFTYKDGKLSYTVYMGNLRVGVALERVEE